MAGILAKPTAPLLLGVRTQTTGFFAYHERRVSGCSTAQKERAVCLPRSPALIHKLTMGRAWRDSSSGLDELGRLRGHGVGHAVLVGLHGLERMVAHDVVALAAPVPGIALAVALAHEVRVEGAGLDIQDLAEALINEHVLSPLAEVLFGHALLWCGAVPASLVVLFQGVDSPAAENLDRAVHAVLAVVDVAGILVLVQQGAQPVGEEDGVGVDLHNPIVLLVVGDVDDLLPHCDEDPRVEGGHGVTTIAALEGAVDDVGGHAICDVNGLVAEDGALVAAEDAGFVLVLPLQHAFLVASGNHQGVAIQAAGGFLLHGRGHLEGEAIRRLTRDEALQGLLLSDALHQPALAGAAVQTGVLHPGVSVALLDALAHGGAHLRRWNVVVVGAPTLLADVLSVDFHLWGQAGEVFALHPGGLILVIVMIFLVLLHRTTVDIDNSGSLHLSMAILSRDDSQGHEGAHNEACDGHGPALAHLTVLPHRGRDLLFKASSLHRLVAAGGLNIHGVVHGWLMR
mmetsp:Transcript_81870/g.171266  ORF Transcript_81870/g.171266 Transcript_81870/m.171266 type:complete len:513 (+) Transcript_81870:97-1635(+)